jgi:dipeptidase D
MSVLDAAVPVFRYFEEISAIPRPSGGEDAIGAYLEAFAARRGYACTRDEAKNVLIRRPGSPGREAEPPLLLQSHTDMVCLSAPAPLKLRLEDGWLRAENSTLGADDGAGVALMLALLEEKDLSCPPLECLFTAGEEAGMTGAMRLRRDAVTARRMVNLDGTGETVTAVSCSGGKRILAHCPVSYAECSLPCLLLTLEGGAGGHSGAEIQRNRSNAIQLGFRLLYRLLERGADIRVVRIAGGSRENAIPTDFRVLFASAAPENLLGAAVRQFEAEIRELYPDEPGLRLTLEKAEKAGSAMTPEDSGALISMGYLLPTGLVALSPSMGIPLVSLNLGVLRQEEGEVTFSFNIRSPLQSQRDELARQIEAVSSIFGGFLTLTAEYPGWVYSPESPLREALRRALAERGQTLREEALHAGLEAGIFSSRYPGMDIITYGPIEEDCHTPRERMDPESLRRSYGVLVRVLELI